MQLNSLIPVFCLLLVSACQSLGLEGLKEQKAREGKKQVGLPCKVIVTEECTEKEVPRFEEVCEWYSEECETEYVKHCENRREKRGVLQAILLTSAIASQNPATTTEAPARVRCYNSPTTTCRHNHDGTIDGHCQTTYTRHCYRARSRRSASEDCAQVPSRHCNLTPGAREGAGVKVCRKVNLPKVEKVCAKVDTLVC
jgi:hypothetical protein